MPYNFMSDNASGVTDSIMQAMLAANAHDGSNPYGADELSAKLRKRFEEFFETKIDFYLTSTGTISNALALAAMTPSYGYIFCHELAHVQIDECGAPELFTGGAQLMLVPGKHGKMCCATLEEKIRQALSFRPHHNKPATITVTQSTECGTVYSLDELKELSAIAHKHNLKVHMDGARLANAIAALGCSPADVTWRCGVDILSFGATKNGALAAEAIIFFDQGLAHDFDYRHKRGGQLFSKARYFSAQFLAYMEDGLWLRNASTANALADRLVKGLLATDLAELLHPVMANEIFVKMPSVLADALRARGPKFYEWENPGHYRFVTSWSHTEAEIDAFLEMVKECAEAAKKEHNLLLVSKRPHEATNGNGVAIPTSPSSASKKRSRVLEGPDMANSLSHIIPSPAPLALS